MITRFLYKYRVLIVDDSNLVPHIWELTTCFSADNKEDAEKMLLKFYENTTILDCELIEVVKFYEEE